MAKKKQIVINEEELTPTTLAVVEDKKKVSILGIFWLFLIFAIFIVGVIYLPEISQYINNYFNPDVVTPDTPSDNKNNTTDDDNKTTIKEYVISDKPEIIFEKFKINNIAVYESNISFDIINTSNEILELANYNYFINLYDQNKKLLQRLMLRDEVVSPNETLKVTFSLTDSNVYSLTILSISKDNYPAYVATADENNMATLTCTKDYEKVDYLLNNNKVYAISLLYEVGVDDANFNTLYGTYQAMQVSYNSIEGVSSSIETINNVLSFRTIINLNTIGDEKINLKTFYPKDTDAKVMNFELTSMGYTCK